MASSVLGPCGATLAAARQPRYAIVFRSPARGAIIFAGLIAACGDPELHLQLEIREPYRANIFSVAVQIIEPPVSQPFTCDDLAFQRVDPSAIAFSRVGEVTSDALTTPIADIDRLATKLFWVDGLDDLGDRIVTGCAAVGPIDSVVDVHILAEPVARTIAPEGVSLSTVVGRPLSMPVNIPVMDALGRNLANASASYTVIGAAGIGSTGQVISDAAGNLAITPELPSKPGPFVLEVRVRWAANEPVLLSGVIAPQVRNAELDGRAEAYEAGAIGPNREKGFAALVTDPPGGARVIMSYRDSIGGVLAMNRTPRILGAPILGRIDFGGRARDRIIVVSSTGWSEVSAEGTLADRPAFMMPAGATLPTRILTSGPCTITSAMDEPSVLIQFSGGIVGVYSVNGDPISSFAVGDPNDPVLQNAEVTASGCVTDKTGVPLRTLVINLGGGIGVFAAVAPEMGENLLAAEWLALGRGIAFGPPGADGRRLMLGTQLSVNDIVVSRATLDRGPNSLTLVFEGNDVVPNVPDITQAGDIDKDGLVDVVSLFRRLDDRSTAVWGVLGREHLGRRISGDVRLGANDLRAPTLMIIDLDADGYDDIVIGELPALVAGGPARSRIEIYSMGQ